MISKTEDEYEDEQIETTDDYDYDALLTRSENIIASRKRSFDNIDSELMDAMREVSIRVDCLKCHRKKGQLCVGPVSLEAPCCKSRMRLVMFKSKKAYDNVHYAMRSKRWKGDMIVVPTYIVKGVKKSAITGKTWTIVECSDPKWKEYARKYNESRRGHI